MNIILSGYGKMGRLIEQRAAEKGHKIAAVIDPAAGSGLGTVVFKNIESLEKIPSGSIAIDFTHPDAAVRNIESFAERRIPLVIGTTGWYDKLDEVTALIKRTESSLLWASNFSIGVNIFYRIAALCAAFIEPYAEYDASGFEVHHNQKADSPSGTAKMIAEQVLKNMKRKTTVVWDKLDRPPTPEEIHFASLRSGATPGVHALIFDSAADSIEIKHTARNREGLVSGAIHAAEWLYKNTEAGKRGVFTMEDILAQ
ncbi:MAG: 4-hydroxy-tetrahydrodipicolinate reductase [Spirochaetaceae bacterium]|jgi:4-hydroxy-tetrahydrodipicolinate reductase|nr:4-hydroxy-tetrahydrodipicolinate reductase [Spirochaetaceae bacterium]